MCADKNDVSALSGRCKTEHSRYNIGTYKERTQHLVLKNYFEPDTSMHEVRVGKYIADIYNSHGICEIQTSGFDKLCAKLEVFLKSENVSVVYPCAVMKRICWCDPETGAVSEGRYRKYPRAKYKLLSELLHISSLFPNDRLTVRLCEVKVSEVRLLDGYGNDKKKRATKTDTLTDEIINITDIKNADDILAMLPFEKGDILTREKISAAVGLRRRNLWKAIKLLLNVGLIEECGKDGRTLLYKVV